MIEYGQKGSNSWTRVSFETLVRVLEGDARPRRTDITDEARGIKKNPYGAAAVMGTDVCHALKMLIAVTHFHVDKDGYRHRMEFRAFDLNSGDFIPDWFATRECMCDRLPCAEASREYAGPEHGMLPYRHEVLRDLSIGQDSTILSI